MDPLTIITTAASIVGTAIKLSKTLYDTIETLKDAPADVRALCTTIDSVKSAVSRLVGFMNDGQQCQWPDEWLEDVMNDIEAISGELKEVQRLIDSWNGQDTGGRMKDAWRNWKWHFNSEETQRCTRRLREAKEDLGFQISVIQLSTTTQTNQDVNEVKNIVGSIKAELNSRGGFDERALNTELSAFAEQMSSLREAILGLGHLGTSPGHNDNGLQNSPQNVVESTTVKLLKGRKSVESTGSDLSDFFLSPLAALNQHAFLQNQQISSHKYRLDGNPMSTAALGLKLAEMQKKHDELLVHWDNAMGHISYLERQLDRHFTSSFANQAGGEEHLDAKTGDHDEEIISREAVIDVLKAQNESLQDMISQRVTIRGYTDDNIDSRNLGKQLLKKKERVNRQQEEIDLLKWRLQGEQSSLREQLKVNKILDDQVKLTTENPKLRAKGNRSKWKGFLNASPHARNGNENNRSTSSHPKTHHHSNPTAHILCPRSSASVSAEHSYGQERGRPRIVENAMDDTDSNRISQVINWSAADGLQPLA